jgi:hypothetical protein
MATLLDIEVEDYSARRQEGTPSPVSESSVGVPIPALLALTLLFTVFVIVAVALSQVAGAC